MKRAGQTLVMCRARSIQQSKSTDDGDAASSPLRSLSRLGLNVNSACFIRFHLFGQAKRRNTGRYIYIVLFFFFLSSLFFFRHGCKIFTKNVVAMANTLGRLSCPSLKPIDRVRLFQVTTLSNHLHLVISSLFRQWFCLVRWPF